MDVLSIVLDQDIHLYVFCYFLMALLTFRNIITKISIKVIY